MSAEISVHIRPGPLRDAVPWDPPPGCGAVLRFEGVARPAEDGRPIAALDYEAYEPMTTREMTKLAADVAAAHGLRSICVEHSTGRVPAGACSFRLRIASPHRKEALRAMDEFIDRMKRDVPLWKKAVGPEAVR